jgi:hypothetical protein
MTRRLFKHRGRGTLRRHTGGGRLPIGLAVLGGALLLAAYLLRLVP